MKKVWPVGTVDSVIRRTPHPDVYRTSAATAATHGSEMPSLG